MWDVLLQTEQQTLQDGVHLRICKGPARLATSRTLLYVCTFGVGKGDKFFNSPFAPMDVTNPKGTPRRPRTRAYTAPNRLLGSENGWPLRRLGGGAGSGADRLPSSQRCEGGGSA